MTKAKEEQMDQRQKQAVLVERRLNEARKALKILADPMNWDSSRDRSHQSIFLNTAAGKGTSERVDPQQLAKEALSGLDEARALVPRFLADEEKEPITLTANMKGEAGMLKKRIPGR